MLALRWIGKKTYTCSYSFVICLVMCMFVLLTGLINNDLTGGYFYKCSILLLSILFTKAIGFEKFAILFEKIIYSLAIISIICFILSSINKDLFSFFPILVNSKGNRFYNLLIDIIPINTSMRNFGIFREPGVYQFFLIISAAFHIHFGGAKLKHILVYVIALIFTYSTTGYLALFGIVVIYILQKSHSRKEAIKKILSVLLICAGFVALFMFTDLLSKNGVIFQKFYNSHSISGIARFASVTENIRIFLSSPILGVGMADLAEKFPLYALSQYGYLSKDNTNTVLAEFATFGFIYGLIIVYGMIGFSKRLFNGKMNNIIFMVTLTILFCGEKFTFNPIVYILLFYGIRYMQFRLSQRKKVMKRMEYHEKCDFYN